MTFEEVVGIYLSAKSHRSKQRDLYSLKRLQPYFGGKNIVDLRRRDLRDYISIRLADGVCESTVKRELKLFSAAINFVRVEHDHLELANPVQHLRLSGGPHRVRWITREQAAELVSTADEYAIRPHLPNFLRLALNTGCRRNEMLGLEWERVDFDRAAFRLEPEHTKGGKRRLIPLNEMAISSLRDQREWVKTHAPGSRWVFPSPWANGRMRTLQKGFAAACARAGIENFRIHDLRHTFASWLAMDGVSLYVIKDLLGHSSISVTERYAHLSPDQGRLAVQTLLSF